MLVWFVGCEEAPETGLVDVVVYCHLWDRSDGDSQHQAEEGEVDACWAEVVVVREDPRGGDDEEVEQAEQEAGVEAHEGDDRFGEEHV